MDGQRLVNAVQSIPHIGQILAVTITIGIAIYQEAKNLDARFELEKELVEETRDVIHDIAIYSQNLRASDPRHLTKIGKQLKKLEEISREIQKHILNTACSRERHERRFGPALADLYDCVIEKSSVLVFEKRLSDAKTKFMEEYRWIRTFEGHPVESIAPPYGLFEMGDDIVGDDSATLRPVRWVNRQEIPENSIPENMVPVCRSDVSEDGKEWYIARVSFFGAYLPGKFKPGAGAFFGHKGEALHAGDRDFDVLVAEPGSVHWVHMSGRFSEDRLRPYRPVKGCRDSDFSELAIVHAWAREHMKIGYIIGTPKAIQPGKAGPNLECAYVIAGEEEKKIQHYEVLVHAPDEKNTYS